MHSASPSQPPQMSTVSKQWAGNLDDIYYLSSVPTNDLHRLIGNVQCRELTLSALSDISTAVIGQTTTFSHLDPSLSLLRLFPGMNL